MKINLRHCAFDQFICFDRLSFLVLLITTIGNRRRHVKNNSKYTKLIHVQRKIIPLHPKIIHGSLINLTYKKIILDINDINCRQKKGDMSKIIQGAQNLFLLREK